MSIKQDRIGSRTAEDLRQRLNVSNINEAKEKVDASVEQVQRLSNQVNTLSNQVTGLNNSVTNTRESYVSTNAQTFTDEQKERARNNIGAGNSSFSGSYNDLKNKPTIPTKTSQLENDSGFITDADDIIPFEVENIKSTSTENAYSCNYVNNLDVAIYDGGNIDPNTTTEGLILTKHANNPYGENNFAYIRTMFYNAKSNTSNRTQIAYPYKTDKSVYKRYYLSGVWSEWTPVVEDTKTYDLSSYKASGVSILRSSCITKNKRVVINFVGTMSIAANTTTELFDLPVELTPTDQKDFVVFGQSSDTTGYVGYGYITTSGSLQVRFTQAISSYIRFSVTYDLD